MTTIVANAVTGAPSAAVPGGASVRRPKTAGRTVAGSSNDDGGNEDDAGEAENDELQPGRPRKRCGRWTTTSRSRSSPVPTTPTCRPASASWTRTTRSEQFYDMDVIIFRDVTDDIRRESELRDLARTLGEQKQAMETVFSSISDGVVAVDEHGKLTIYNPSAGRIVGREATSRASTPANGPTRTASTWATRVTPARSEDLPLAGALRGEPSDDVELFVRNENVPDGVHVSASGRPLRDASGASRGGVVVFRDITRLSRVRSENCDARSRICAGRTTSWRWCSRASATGWWSLTRRDG